MRDRFSGLGRLTIALLTLLAVLVVIGGVGWAVAAFDVCLGLKVGRNGIRVGNTSAYNKFRVGGSTGDVYAAGTAQLARALTMYVDADNDYTVPTTAYGQVIRYAPTSTATVTLPANGAAAGSRFELVLLTDVSTTISAATADTLLTNGNAAADGVSFQTSSHKIGSRALFISDGTRWEAYNIGDTTMTVVDN